MEATVQQEQETMKPTELAGLTNREPEKTFAEMIVDIGDSLSDPGSSNNRDDEEDDDDEETEQHSLREDDELGWVMGTITNTVLQCTERFRQKQIELDELTQPGWENTTKYFCDTDKKYRVSELRVLAFVQP